LQQICSREGPKKYYHWGDGSGGGGMVGKNTRKKIGENWKCVEGEGQKP